MAADYPGVYLEQFRKAIDAYGLTDIAMPGSAARYPRLSIGMYKSIRDYWVNESDRYESLLAPRPGGADESGYQRSRALLTQWSGYSGPGWFPDDAAMLPDKEAADFWGVIGQMATSLRFVAEQPSVWYYIGEAIKGTFRGLTDASWGLAEWALLLGGAYIAFDLYFKSRRK